MEKKLRIEEAAEILSRAIKAESTEHQRTVLLEFVMARIDPVEHARANEILKAIKRGY